MLYVIYVIPTKDIIQLLLRQSELWMNPFPFDMWAKLTVLAGVDIGEHYQYAIDIGLFI